MCEYVGVECGRETMKRKCVRVMCKCVSVLEKGEGGVLLNECESRGCMRECVERRQSVCVCVCINNFDYSSENPQDLER